MAEDAYSLLMKGRGLLSSEHPHQAAIVLERALELEPSKSSIREEFARALFLSGQPGKAKKHFQHIVEDHPADHYAHYGLGLCFAKLGRFALARRHLKLAVASRPNDEAYLGALKALPSAS